MLSFGFLFPLFFPLSFPPGCRLAAARPISDFILSKIKHQQAWWISRTWLILHCCWGIKFRLILPDGSRLCEAHAMLRFYCIAFNIKLISFGIARNIKIFLFFNLPCFKTKLIKDERLPEIYIWRINSFFVTKSYALSHVKERKRMNF